MSRFFRSLYFSPTCLRREPPSAGSSEVSHNHLPVKMSPCFVSCWDRHSVDVASRRPVRRDHGADHNVGFRYRCGGRQARTLHLRQAQLSRPRNQTLAPTPHSDTREVSSGVKRSGSIAVSSCRGCESNPLSGDIVCPGLERTVIWRFPGFLRHIQTPRLQCDHRQWLSSILLPPSMSIVGLSGEPA